MLIYHNSTAPQVHLLSATNYAVVGAETEIRATHCNTDAVEFLQSKFTGNIKEYKSINMCLPFFIVVCILIVLCLCILHTDPGMRINV